MTRPVSGRPPPWSRITTGEQRAEIARRYRGGESMASIGRDFGIGPATIRRYLLDQGVELRPHPKRGFQVRFGRQFGDRLWKEEF